MTTKAIEHVVLELVLDWGKKLEQHKFADDREAGEALGKAVIAIIKAVIEDCAEMMVAKMETEMEEPELAHTVTVEKGSWNSTYVRFRDCDDEVVAEAKLTENEILGLVHLLQRALVEYRPAYGEHH